MRWYLHRAAVAAGFGGVLLAVSIASPRGDDARVDAARRAMDSGRYAEAESALVRLVSRGEADSESFVLLGELQTDGGRARRYFEKALQIDPGSRWARTARVELAKIDYALGRYDSSWRMLDEADACDDDPEACLFQGLSALMLDRLEQARIALRRIRRGKTRTWAWIALAEADARRGRSEEACERYEALSDAMVSPTAAYRYGECLENRGQSREAVDMFERLAGQFPGTPEGVLAAEKVHRMGEVPKPSPEPRAANADPVEVLERGFTIQFGSFRDRGNAIKLASRIRRVYPGVRIDTELLRYREHHRVRYGYFKTRADAEEVARGIATELNETYSIMTLP